MKYVYTNDIGQVISAVETGDDHPHPAGSLIWPSDLPFRDALLFGYDQSRNEWLRPETSAPSQYHEFDFVRREWRFNHQRAEQEARSKRDWELLQMDMKIANPLRWASLSDEQKSEWAAYRQSLLDVPQQKDFPANVLWPVAPH